jgi:hypothetical protein
MDGYVLLLGIAHRQFQNSVRFFEEYWLDANYAIQREVAGRLEYDRDDLALSRTIATGSVQYRGENIANCLALVSFAAKLKHQSPVGLRGRKQYQIGEVRYQLECELGKVGDAWYVSTSKWDSAVVKIAVNRQGKWS